ncbi:MAG: helix-turn-helix domain-containing protein [Theionarchaea archaeon]|nr:helix-turn-helix domain-containing protein [Theionarchaea archaeon]
MTSVEEQIRELRESIEKLSQRIEEMKKAGVGTPSGVRRQILKMLEEENEPYSVGEIAERIGRAESTVSGYLLDLYENGFVERNSRLINVGDSRRVRQLEYFIPQQKRRKWHYL